MTRDGRTGGGGESTGEVTIGARLAPSARCPRCQLSAGGWVATRLTQAAARGVTKARGNTGRHRGSRHAHTDDDEGEEARRAWACLRASSGRRGRWLTKRIVEFVSRGNTEARAREHEGRRRRRGTVDGGEERTHVEWRTSGRSAPGDARAIDRLIDDCTLRRRTLAASSACL